MDNIEQNKDSSSKDLEISGEESPGNTGVIRDDKGRFVPGVSGNPDGKPKGSLSLVALLKRELEKISEGEKMTYADVFIKKVLKGAIIDGDVQLLKEIFNRVDGMPKQIFGVDGDDIITKLTIEVVPPKADGEKDTNNNSISEEPTRVSEQKVQNNS